MTPTEFVEALKALAFSSAASEADYFAAPHSSHPVEHLARFSAWFQRLSPSEQEIARDALRYANEHSLHGLLTYLDNLTPLTEERGTFELWFVSEGGERVRLNDPGGEFLNELFGNFA